MKPIALLFALLVSVFAYNNGLGATPPMGWNSWCTKDFCGTPDLCTDKLVRQQAKAMVDSGMKSLGYEYVVMDDCWSDQERDANGNLQPNPERFPYGMKNLADYVHSLGLKIGLYTSAGIHTCRWNRPGCFGHYEQDAKHLALDWEVDFIKMDNCGTSGVGVPDRELYFNMSTALNKTGRPVLFSLCNWGDDDVMEWGSQAGQMFRYQADHHCGGAGNGQGQGTLDIINYMGTLNPSTITKQYGWMDPDFLETLFISRIVLGEFGEDFINSRTEYSFWAIWSSPLMVATNIYNMTDEKQQILLNKEVIAVNQDSLSTSADLITTMSNGCQIWSKPLSSVGEKAFIMFNPKNFETETCVLNFQDVGIPSGTSVTVRNLWKKTDVGSFMTSFQAKVAKHDVFMGKLTYKI